MIYRLFVISLFLLPITAQAQTEGEVMFVGWSSDGTDGFAFVALVDIANTTNIHFNDNEWNELPIGGGGAFNGVGETEMTWQNNTGAAITAGTVITVTSSNTTPVVDVGTIVVGTISLAASNEVLYMFLGTDRFTPTSFISAAANDGFSATSGSLVNTGLTAGVDATSITGDEDIMLYLNNNNCNGTVAECAALIATAANWTTEDGGGDQSANGYPDFPADVCDVAGTLLYPAQNYYSLVSGSWDANTSWSLTSDGSSGALAAGEYPRRTDNVVIRSGHTITVDAVDDNKSCGVSPEGLNRTNVGAWPTSSNQLMFYHTGDIIIDNMGILDLTALAMFEGYTYINGEVTTTVDLVNLGSIEVTSSGTFDSSDDIILSGNSLTVIDNTSEFGDDIYMDHTDALLCGTGSIEVGSGNFDPEIQYLNGATEAQICSSLTITCVGTQCGAIPFAAPGSPGNFSLGYLGPAGVGTTDGSSTMVLWVDANSFSQADNTPITTNWTDLSGTGNNASPLPASSEPLFFNNFFNGQPLVGFTTGYFSVPDNASLNSTSISVLTVATTTGAGLRGLVSKLATATTNGHGLLIDATNLGSYFYVDAVLTNFLASVATFTALSPITISATYDQADLLMYNDGVSVGGGFSYASGITLNTNPLYLGAIPDVPGTGVLLGPAAGISEAVVFGEAISDAQRILIENYLSAKYGVAMGANDVYVQDDNANGDFDFDVAGVGQDTNGEFNKDAKGTGLVRVNLANDLGNNEYMMWGHDGTSISSVNTTDVDGTIIEARLERVWRVSENDNTGSAVDVGTVRLTFDGQNLPPTIVGSDIRLLITRDNALFIDNDVTPQAGSYNIDDQLITFSNVDLQDGDYFTLGTIDNTNSPLPIDLISFSASPLNEFVNLVWITASELNNDFFTIERSKNAQDWEIVTSVDGLGTTNISNEYSTVDDHPYSGISYYRLKQTDFDGTFTYSNVVSVVLESIEKLEVYPNPSEGSFIIKTQFELDNASILIHNLAGKRIQSTVVRNGFSAKIIMGQAPSGLYIVEVSDGYKVYRKKFQISH